CRSQQSAKTARKQPARLTVTRVAAKQSSLWPSYCRPAPWPWPARPDDVASARLLARTGDALLAIGQTPANLCWQNRTPAKHGASTVARGEQRPRLQTRLIYTQEPGARFCLTAQP